LNKYLTLDVGTTAVKAALFDSNFQLLDLVINEYMLLTPEEGIVELPADVYWENSVSGIRTILERTKSSAEEIRTITCTTQGETLIPIDKEGKALHNAVVWLDARAKEESECLSKQFTKEEFFAKTGIPEVTAYCPVAKLLWFKNKKPDIYEAADKFLLLEDFLIYRLTGKMVTNPSICCSTGYLNIGTGQLWKEVFLKNQLSMEKIPKILPCGTQVAALSHEVAVCLRLTEKTIVTTGAMDQVASAVGAGNWKDGIVSETTGTCLCVAASLNNPMLEQWSPVPVYSHCVEGLYLKVAVVQTAGMILKWFRDEFCPDLFIDKVSAYDKMSGMAETVPPLARGVMLVPYLTGTEANSRVRGAFTGLGLETTRECCIRAVMEAMGYTLREKLEEMQIENEQIISLGGASKSNVWNQIKADICGKKIVILEAEESTSLGAAILGALAVGDLRSMETVAEQVRTKQSYTPITENTVLYEAEYKKFRNICELIASVYK